SFLPNRRDLLERWGQGRFLHSELLSPLDCEPERWLVPDQLHPPACGSCDDHGELSGRCLARRELWCFVTYGEHEVSQRRGDSQPVSGNGWKRDHVHLYREGH